jgi:hypothetical protein
MNLHRSRRSSHLYHGKESGLNGDLLCEGWCYCDNTKKAGLTGLSF